MTAPRLFAVLVGIDKYVSGKIPNLSGCVSDAQSIRQYLVDSLDVPIDHILMLADGSATREAILQALQDQFINNDRIVKGDAMLFYFAGHGSRYNAPPGWTTDDGQVETITPHDENVGTKVYGIPDRTLFALLHMTAKVRGNNITTILDCCHSGSGTRGTTEGVIRGHDNFITIPVDLDGEILSEGTNRRVRHTSAPMFLGGSMSSHVLLSACRQDEHAREVKIGSGSTVGIFTHQLIEAMRQSSTCQTTYAGLLDMLPSLPNQHPQCEGDNKHCLLFTTLQHHDDRFFKVKKLSVDVEVEAGKVHGVVKGTEFVLHEKANSASPSFGRFFSTSVRATSSKLVPLLSRRTDNIPHVSYALVSRWGSPDAKLAVFVNTHLSSMATLETTSPAWTMVAPVSISRVSLKSKADIILHDVGAESDHVRIDSVIGSHLGTLLQTQIDVPRDRIVHILRSAAHFKFHLIRTNTSQPLHSLVTLELYQLMETEDGLYVPTGHNLVCDGRARIILNDNLYGVTLRNNSGYNLFPSLFYFDPSDFSIQPCYLPPSSTMSAPLRQKSMLTIGHGNNDGHAIQFHLTQHDRSDTGFLVLFLSTQYADIAHIQQSSALDGSLDRQATLHNAEPCFWDRAHAVITVARTNDDFEPTSPAVPGGFGTPPATNSWLSSLQERVSGMWQ